jgi:polyisoprenoid-binding protein YceI
MLRQRLVAIAILGLTTPLFAGEQVLRIDAKASAVTFELPATAHVVRGVLQVESGEIRFDPGGGPASGEIVVDAKSGRTGNASRDDKMHTKVLESAKFSRIVFKPAAIDGELAPAGESAIKIRGTMSVHGVDRPMSLPVTVNVTENHVTGRTSFAVPFVAWGMDDPSVFLLRVAKEVQVHVVLQGTLAAVGEQ